MVSIIVAIGKNRELGRGGDLIWRISDDLKRFKKLTTGHTIIMGRKTYESIGKPLPDRENIVVTKNLAWYAEGATVATTVDEGLAIGMKRDEKEVFVIGGGEIYKQALPFTDRLYITLIDADAHDADTFFPEYSEFTKVISKEEHPESEPPYTYIVLEK